jgi:hypothetical protein
MAVGQLPRRQLVVIAAGAVLAGVFVALPGTAAAAPNVLKADKAVPRSCFAGLLKAGTAGTDEREFTSTVDGLVQARLKPVAGAEGDWDIAVFDKTTGGVVAASAALRSREVAESFVKKGQQLVVQACRYAGPARTVELGVDFLALTPQGTSTTTPPELVRVEHRPGRTRTG